MDPKRIIFFYGIMLVVAAQLTSQDCVPHFCVCKRYEVHCEMPEDANAGEFTYYTYAEDQCAQRGGYLANLVDAEIDSMVRDFIVNNGLEGPPCINRPSHGFFIGLRDVAYTYTYHWSNGKPLCSGSFTNWAPGEPDNNTVQVFPPPRGCVQLWYRFGHHGLWDDVPCNSRPKGYICEIPVHCCCSEAP